MISDQSRARVVFYAAVLSLSLTARADGATQTDPERLPTRSGIETPVESLTARFETPSIFKASRFRAVIFTRNDVYAVNPDGKSPDLVSTNRAGVRYRLTDESNLGLMQEFQYLYVQERHLGNYLMRDTYLQYINNRVAELPGDWTLILRYKQFFPTGEISRLTGRHGVETLGFFENRRAGRFEFEFQHIGSYYNQSANTYISKKGKTVPTDDHEFDNYFQAGYFVNEHLQLWHAIGLELDWERAPPKKAAARHSNLHNETGVSYRIMKQVLMSVSYANGPEFESNNRVHIYNDEDSIYRAVLDIKI